VKKQIKRQIKTSKFYIPHLDLLKFDSFVLSEENINIIPNNSQKKYHPSIIIPGALLSDLISF